MNHDELKAAYNQLFDLQLKPLAERLEGYLEEHFSDLPRIDSISARAKSVDRFLAKAEKENESDGNRKYSEPLNQIQDMLGARIVVHYLTDVEAVSKRVSGKQGLFQHIGKKKHKPDSVSEFGYVGEHFILQTPIDCLPDGVSEKEGLPFFELQIKTLFQHAWSEAEHDLGYKTEYELTEDQRRRIAFAAASAWGADRMFRELSDDLI